MMTRTIFLRAVLGVATAAGLVSCSATQGQGGSAGSSSSGAASGGAQGAFEEQAKQVQEQIASQAAQQETSPAALADARQVQAQVMDFADEMTLRLAEAVDLIESSAPTMDGRIVAHRLKYTVAHGAVIIASAQNPRIALVDMYVMISLQRALIERKIIPEYYGQESARLAETFDRSEQEIRGLAEKALTPEQIQEIDRLIADWLEKNPDRMYASYVRFSEFSAARQVSTVKLEKNKASNVLGYLFIDPLSGLDPTTREIEQARLFAERAFFYLQRMPMLVSWQAELLLIDTASEPESRRVLTSVETISESVERITQELVRVREQIPELVSAEREAAIEQAGVILDQQRQLAIEQALAGVSAERRALIEQIAAEEERLGPVIAELRLTIDSATALSESVRTTTEQFGELAAQLHLDEPKDPEANPTDITDYTEALRETTRAAGELVKLTESMKDATAPDELDARLALIEQRLGDAEESANRVLGRAFRLGLILIGALVAGLALVAIVGARLRGRPSA